MNETFGMANPNGVKVWIDSEGPVNVSEYGAVGDGVTDDTEAFNAAIAAAIAKAKAAKVMEFVTAPPQRPATAPRETVEWTQAWTGKPSGATLAPRMGAACNAYKVSDYTPNSPEWLAARAGRLGGSDCGTLIGAGFKTWDELLADKAIVQEAKPPTEAMNRGNWLEPACLAYAASKGYVADPSMHGTWRNGDYPYFSVNPDGVDVERSTYIECKSTRMRDKAKWGRAGTDQIPLGYLAQVTVVCGVLGLTNWVVPVLATKTTTNGSDFDFALYRGTFNPGLFTALVERADAFMADLQEFRRLMA